MSFTAIKNALKKATETERDKDPRQKKEADEKFKTWQNQQLHQANENAKSVRQEMQEFQKVTKQIEKLLVKLRCGAATPHDFDVLVNLAGSKYGSEKLRLMIQKIKKNPDRIA